MILKNGKRLDGCSDTVPIGTLNPYIGSTPPFGYLICEGQLVDKATYPELYAICGSTFGTETTTQFYLPDLRGQTIAGYKQGDSDFGTLGALIGSKYLQEHQHKDITWGKNGREYMYTGVDGSDTVFNLAGSGVFTSYYDKNGTTHIYTGNVDTDVATGNSGNIQPTMVLNWIVKAFMLMPNQSMVSTVETTSDINTYSCNYINNIGEWKLLGTRTGDSTINLPSNYKELYCDVIANDNLNIHIPVIIPRSILDTTEKGFNGGYFVSTNTNAQIRVKATTTSIYCAASYLNNNDVLSNTVTNYYYR